MVQIKLKGVIGVESPCTRSFWCGHTYDFMVTRGSYVTHMRSAGDLRKLAQSCQTYEWVVSRGWLRHVPQINEACRRYGTAMSHTWTRQVMRMNEACHTHRWVISHIGMAHVTHVTPDIYWPQKRVMSRTQPRALLIRLSHVAHTRMSHVTHIKESCHTNMNESCHTWYCRELPRRALRMSYEWVISHKFEGVMSHMLQWMTTGLIAANCSMNKLWISHVTHTPMSHVTNMNESCHTNMKNLCHTFHSGWLRGLLPWIVGPGSELQCDWKIG